MFRDLKEYQDIAKIYADKVSKPENLEERRGTDLSKDQIQKNREGLKNRIMYGNPEGKKPVSTSQSNRQKLTQQRQKQNKGRVEKQFGFLKTKPSSEFQGRKSRSSQNMQGKPKPEPKYKPEKGVVFGQRTNEVGAQGGGKPSTGDLSMFKDKEAKPLTKKQKFDAKFIKKDKGAGFVKRGTPMAQRAENKEKAKLKAQALAKARIAAKKEGTASTPMSGKERAQAMAKARIAAKKKAEMSEGAAAIPMIAGGVGKALGAAAAGIGAAGMMMQSKKKQGTKGGQGFGGEKPANAEVKAPKKVKKPRLNIGKRASGRDRNFIQGGGAGGMESVEYDAYDLVLEYLLSTEQAATIEEANYVMTEMDAETIQGIVEEQKKNFDEGLASMALKTGLVVGGAALAKKGLDKAKKSFDNYLNKQRDKGIGGNTRPGSDKIYYGK